MASKKKKQSAKLKDTNTNTGTGPKKNGGHQKATNVKAAVKRNGDNNKNKTDTTTTVVKVKKHRLTREETCDLIAELSESILEDPTKAFSAPDASKDTTTATANNNQDDAEPNQRTAAAPSMMRQLLTIASHPSDEYTSQLAILSLLAIYRDILPSYRIRLPTESEMSVKVSLETKRLWDYERALLTNYQNFLKLLETIWNKGKKSSQKRPSQTTSSAGVSRLMVTSMLCVCELLKVAFHFNFRSNLLTMVIRQINNGECEEVSNACCAAVEHVFAQDVQGEVALEATRLLAKLIKDRNFKVRANVLRTFLALPLRVHIDEAEAAKIATTAKKRKRDKDLREIDKELQEGSATVDKIVLARCQSDALQAVTVTYFRILKCDNLNTSTHMRELLPACLEGLAKVAHLINIDTVMDLLAVLKDLLKDIDALPLDAALNCVLTAFQTLSGPGREMQIDQKEYISPLYTQLPRLITESNQETGTNSTETMLKCLEAAFIKRREYSTTRVAAFLKQILTVAMLTPPSTAIPLMAFGRQLLQRYSSAQQLLENEEDAITSGQYCPDVEEPELANPFSTSAWELATLKFHCHPGVEQQAKHAASNTMLQMPTEDPDRLMEATLRDEKEVFIKCPMSKKRHPLESRGQGDGKKRQRLRFLQAANNTDTNKLDRLSRVSVFL